MKYWENFIMHWETLIKQEQGEKRARSDQQFREIKARLAIVDDDLQKTRGELQGFSLK